MQTNNVLRPGAPVQVVNVLCDQGEVRRPLFQPGQREVARVRFGSGDSAAAFFVPLPDHLRVAPEAFGCGQILKALTLPVTAVGSKGGDSTFG